MNHLLRPSTDLVDDTSGSIGSIKEHYRNLPPQVIYLEETDVSSSRAETDGFPIVEVRREKMMPQLPHDLCAVRDEQHVADLPDVSLSPSNPTLSAFSDGSMSFRTNNTSSTISSSRPSLEPADHIQVAVRVRPLAGKDTNAEDPAISSPPRTRPSADTQAAWEIERNSSNFVFIQEGISRQTPGKNTFFVDTVLDESTCNQQVYDQATKSVVEGVSQGRNGTFFAYGQTGSGKTFTMQGTNYDRNEKNCFGVIQLAASDLFAMLEQDASITTSKVRAQYFELYNEQVIDLLTKGDSCTLLEKSLRSSTSTPTPGMVRAESTGTSPTRSASISSYRNSSLSSSSSDLSSSASRSSATTSSLTAHLSAEEVTCVEDVVRLLRYGNRNRACGATKRNASSSRSHAVFRLTVESRGEERGERFIRASTLNLVDLAGSENSKSAGVTGLRKREGGKINQSLLSLSRVIRSLSLPVKKRPKHIGFRDSKLTRLLQPHLEGNACVSILCCISLAKAHVEETRSTLKFSDCARRVSVKPVVNEVIDNKSLLAAVQRELASTKAALAKLRVAYALATQEGVGKGTARAQIQAMTEAPEKADDEDSSSTVVCLGGDGEEAAHPTPLKRQPKHDLPHDVFVVEESTSPVVGNALAAVQRVKFLESKLESTDQLVEALYQDLRDMERSNMDLIARNNEMLMKKDYFDDTEAVEELQEQIAFLKYAVMFGLFMRIFGQSDVFMGTAFFTWLCIIVFSG